MVHFKNVKNEMEKEFREKQLILWGPKLKGSSTLWSLIVNKPSYSYIHFQGLTKMRKAFSSPLIVNIIINIDIVWHGKRYCDNIFGHIPQPCFRILAI